MGNRTTGCEHRSERQHDVSSIHQGESDMAFWIILAIMTSTAAALLSVPFIRRVDRRRAAAAGDIEVYRDRLKEVESERRSGVIDDAQAEAARLEIVKRALITDKTEQPAMPILSGRERNFAAICMTGIMVLGSVGLYAAAGNPASALDAVVPMPHNEQPRQLRGSRRCRKILLRRCGRLFPKPRGSRSRNPASHRSTR